MSTSPNEPSKLGGNTEARRIRKGAAAAALAAFNASYLIEPSTRSHTINYALLDSTVALAAWMLDHGTDSYYKISRAFLGGPPSGNLTRDHILDNVTLYRLTSSGLSAAPLVLGEQTSPIRRRRPDPSPRHPPGRVQRLPRRDLPGPAQLGPDRLPDPHVLQQARQGRALSPPGKSRNCSRSSCGRRSGPCASRRQEAARAVPPLVHVES
jgi:hypothetical protein